MNHLSYKHVKVHKGNVYVFEDLRVFNSWKNGFFVHNPNIRVYDAVPGVYKVNDIVGQAQYPTIRISYVAYIHRTPQYHTDKDGKFLYMAWAIPLFYGDEIELV